jgi:PAS domain S-box-containing protein
MTSSHKDLTQEIARLEEKIAELEARKKTPKERNQGLFHNISVGVYQASLNGKILAANAAVVEMLGFPSEEALLSKKLEDFYVNRGDRKKLFKAIAERGVVRGYPLQLRKHDGEIIWVEVFSQRISAGKNEIFEGVLIEVTERIQAAQKLKESEEKFAKAFAGSPLLVVLSVYSSERILDVNKSFLETTGYQRNEVVGQTLKYLDLWVNPKEADKLGLLVKENQGSVRDLDFLFRMRDGEPRLFSLSIEMLEITGETCVLTVAEDITERKQAAQALIESETRLRTLSSATFEGIALVDEGVIIDANEQFAEILGYLPTEVIGTKVITHVHADDHEFVNQQAENKVEQPYEHRALHKSGSTVSVEIRPRTIITDGRTLRVAAIRDISERKRAENAVRASEEKFSTVFHASPTPISISTFPNSHFIEVNESFLQASGYDRSEVIDKSIYEVGLWARESDREAMMRELSTHHKITNFEADYVQKNGEVSTALISAEFITLEGERYLLSSFQDIFERKTAEIEIRRRVRQLAAINEMGQVVASSLAVSEVLNQVVEASSILVDAEWVSVLMLEYQGEFIVRAAGGENSKKFLGQHISSNQGIAGQVIQTEQAVLLTGEASELMIGHYISETIDAPVQSLLAVPLMLGGHVIGVMEALHSQPNAFDRGDLDVMGTAATWVAIAIANARQHEALQRRLQESQALATISQALNETLDLDRVLYLIADAARNIIPQVERAVIHLFDENQGLLLPISVSSLYEMGEPYLAMEPGVGIAGQAMDKGITINIRDTENDPRFVPITGRSGAYLRSLMVAPVQSGDRRLGTISVSSASKNAFSGDDEHLLGILGIQAALAIESARLFEETRQRAHYLEMLSNMTSTALQIPDLNTILQSLAGQLVVLFESDGCYVNLWDNETNRIRQTTSHGKDIMDTTGLTSPPGERTMTESVLEAKRVLVVSDVFDTPYLSPKIAEMFPAKSIMALPLISDELKIGSAIIGFNEPHHFMPEEIAIGEQISRQATLVIEKALLLEAEQQRRQEAETLREVAITLASTLDLDTVLNQILIYLEKVIPYSSAGIILIEPDGLHIVAGQGFEYPNRIIGEYLPIDSPILAEVRAQQRSIIIADVQTDPRWKTQQGLDTIHGWMGTPLIYNQEVIGFLTIDNIEVDAYQESDAVLAQILANQATIAIQNARLYAATRRRLSEVDTLYRINNQILDSLDANVDQILHQIVNLLWQDFGYYHVHVYMLDHERKILTVQQGSGPIGEQLAAETHHITLDEGCVGYVAAVGEAYMTNDVTEIHFFKPNPLLPDTLAEMAAPLVVRGQLIGVLDIQHKAPNSFDGDDFRLLQLVADQVAVVLDKAMLYAELQDALQKEHSIRTQLIQTEKLAAMGRLVASVAHELNNPLQAIQNALYLVKMEETLSSQANEDIQVALDETARMGNLIAQLRDAYRPQVRDEFVSEVLNNLVGEVEKLIATHLRHNQISFDFIPDENLPATKINRDQIKQVILNLCLNAVESMSNGGSLTVQTEMKFDENLYEPVVTLKVIDNGPGIPPEIITNIFEPFFTTKEKGTGLGLFISYEIIQNHGGNLEVFNDSNGGAVFQLTLPTLDESRERFLLE